MYIKVGGQGVKQVVCAFDFIRMLSDLTDPYSCQAPYFGDPMSLIATGNAEMESTNKFLKNQHYSNTKLRVPRYQRPPIWPLGMGGIQHVSTCTPRVMTPMTQNALG